MKIRLALPIGCLAVFALLLSGCAPTLHFYDGPNLSSDEVAVLRSRSFIVGVDGQVVPIEQLKNRYRQHEQAGGGKWMKIALLPGPHTITVRSPFTIGKPKETSFSLEVSAGRKYTVISSYGEEDRSKAMWIYIEAERPWEWVWPHFYDGFVCTQRTYVSWIICVIPEGCDRHLYSVLRAPDLFGPVWGWEATTVHETTDHILEQEIRLEEPVPVP